jgi:hypothetical protein
MATATTTKPKLPQLQTPKTATFPSSISSFSATFPSELSARSASARSPLPGFADFIKLEDGIKTPITPPTAYTDFLKSMASPPLTGNKHSGGWTPTSAPSDTSSEHSNCSCNCDTHKSPASVMPSPFALPTSAPSSARLHRLRIPPSPALSETKSPLSATSNMRSPFSARSPYEWDITKGRYFDAKSPKTNRCGVRHVREIVTRTVTYTPQMNAAPKGKRRKVE